MNFLSSPNLPKTRVKTVPIGNGYTEIVNELQNIGIDVIELNLNKKLGLLANHADMLVFDGGNGNFVIDIEQDILCEKINKQGGTVKNTSFEDSAAYPKDVLLNAAVVGEYLICNKKTISCDILDFTDYKIIDINQGYSKCSTCIVNSQAIITDDISVDKATDKLSDLEKLCINRDMTDACNELKVLVKTLEDCGMADKINLDFSIISDTNYYSGVVFRGYVDKLPESVLSGGRYDNLLANMGKSGGAVGFAVYSDMLERLDERVKEFDCDVLLTYEDGTEFADIYKAAEGFKKDGLSVNVQKVDNGEIRYKKLCNIKKGGEVTNG